MLTFLFQHETNVDMQNAKEAVIAIYKSSKEIERVVLECAADERITRADIDKMKSEGLSMQGSILALERAYSKSPEPEVGG